MWELGLWDSPHLMPTAEVIEDLHPKVRSRAPEEEGVAAAPFLEHRQVVKWQVSFPFFHASLIGCAPLPRTY